MASLPLKKVRSVDNLRPEKVTKKCPQNLSTVALVTRAVSHPALRPTFQHGCFLSQALFKPNPAAKYCRFAVHAT
jgi:hypothetical protein